LVSKGVKMEHKVRKTEGGAHIFLLGMCVFIILFFIMVTAYWDRVANASYEKIDSAVTNSLLSTLIPNIELTYASGTGTGIIISSTDYAGTGDIGNIQNDPFLDQCYERFLSSLKTNLNLDDNLLSSNPMLHGEVKVRYLRLYEVKKLNEGGFCVTQYYCSNGTWILEKIMEGPDIPAVAIHATWDGETKELERTSMEAKVELCLYTRANGRKLYETGTPPEEVTTNVNYHRMVQITDYMIENW